MTDFQHWMNTTFIRSDEHKILDGYRVLVKAIPNPVELSAAQAYQLALHLFACCDIFPGDDKP